MSMCMVFLFFFFFFQAEDGIRDLYVTGVQTCALPICCGYACRQGGPYRVDHLIYRFATLRQRSGMLIGFGGGLLMAAAGYFHDASSGTVFGYGIGNMGKILGPLGLALIVGSSNYVNPQATVEAIFPAFLFLAFWYVLAACVFWLIAPETKGRSIEEIDKALSERESATLMAT